MEQRNMEDIIVDKIAGHRLPEKENELFDRWYGSDDNRLHYESLLRARAGVIASEAGSADIEEAWKKVNLPAKRLSAGRRIMRYAAILLLPICAGLGFVVYQNRQAAIAENISVKPGEGRAVLVTPTGERIALADLKETIYDEKGVVKVIGVPGAILHYESMPVISETGRPEPDNKEVYQTIEIPKGGYWTLILSDGTRIHLNNDSRLRYPLEFTEEKRIVELEGEAYFRVAKNDKKPFIVRTGDYDIRVTGTEFNVKSYSPGTTATTLIEGGVDIEMNGIVSKLTPNRQATITDGRISTREVNTERYVAWDQDAFFYSSTPLSEIMDELSRWYDIEVIWKDIDAGNYHFSAWFSRKSAIGEIIEILEKTNRIELTLKGKTLTVRDKNHKERNRRTLTTSSGGSNKGNNLSQLLTLIQKTNVWNFYVKN